MELIGVVTIQKAIETINQSYQPQQLIVRTEALLLGKRSECERRSIGVQAKSELGKDCCRIGTSLMIKHLKNAPIEYKSEDGFQTGRYILNGKRLTKTSSEFQEPRCLPGPS